jgi:hypothetical protein
VRPPQRSEGETAAAAAAGKQAGEVAALKAQLAEHLAAPLQPSISRKFFAGGVSALAAAAATAKAAGPAEDGEVGLPPGAAALLRCVRRRVQGSRRCRDPAAAVGRQSLHSRSAPCRALPPTHTPLAAAQVRPVPVEAINQTVQLAARLQQSKLAAAQGNGSRKARAAAARAAAQQQHQKSSQLLVSRNQMKKRAGKGLVVIPGAFGRDAQAPNALDALKQRLAVLK